MSNEWENGPGNTNNSGQPNQEDIDKRIEEIRRVVSQSATEAQQRIKRVVDKVGEYWQQAQTAPTPRQATNIEEQRVRQLANMWSSENWRVARELGNYMDVISWSTDEVWEITLQTRWEARTMETVSEPYTGRTFNKIQPVLPVWDYELSSPNGLRAPMSRTRIEGLDEVLSCTACNSTGRVLCTTCTGRGWVVCPDCRGRTKKRCNTCRGRGYVADWKSGEKKPFFKKQAENIANSVNERVSDVFEGIRQQGVPIPNPVDTDPANKGQTVPCPDCVNGEVDCTCGNGKRVCSNCEGAKTSACANCGGTGKVVRHREIVRRFDLRVDTKVFGNNAIPERQLQKAGGELIYSAEITEALSPAAPPDQVPQDVWNVAVELAKAGAVSPDKSGVESSRATLQVLELVRIPYTKVNYRYGEQDYTFYAYDSEGKEKFYAERYPARWDRIERLVKAISADLMTPAQSETPNQNQPFNSSTAGYRVPIEVPPYSITEEDEDKPNQ